MSNMLKTVLNTILRFAVSYARVSTEDQARMGLSVPAQFRRNEEYAEKNNIKILFQDADEGVSAYRDNENREAFWRCVDYACQDKRVTLFLVDDSSRFVRDKYLSGEVKNRLRKHGVRVLIASNPYDTSTIQGAWMESIDEARSQTASMQTAFDTIRGMEENASKRDPVTGWCYKNGGVAPFGYRAYHVVRIKDKRGQDIIKTLWEINEEAAEIKRFMHQKRIEGLGYKAIRELLNENNMLAPTPGKPWTISSVIEMLREDRVLQDAGVYFWNKEDHDTPGRRFKDKSEWVRVENAHPAIITMEEALAVISVNKSHSRANAYSKTSGSSYLLTGKNILGEDMFICAKCEVRMTGHQPARKMRKRYFCGTAHYRGSSFCPEAKPVDKEWLESFLFGQIRKIFGTKKAVKEIADRINKEAVGDNDSILKTKINIGKQINAIDAKISNLVRAVANGFDFQAAKCELDSLKMEKAEQEEKLKTIELEVREKPEPIDAKDVQKLFVQLKEAYKLQNTAQKRELLRCFVRRLEYDSTADLLRVYIFGQPIKKSACKLTGAQDRT
jgi:Site-specific recombinases, DNA invertase Pin homologs